MCKICSNTFEIKAWETGNPDQPMNIIPGKAIAFAHMRFIKGTRSKDIIPILRRHLNKNGYNDIKIKLVGTPREATRLNPNHPYVRWTINSIKNSTNLNVDIIPNLGSTIPNDIFSESLNIPTIWIPHSYGGCSQHAPNEHIIKSTARNALKIMTGIWWDFGEKPPKILKEC